MEDKTSILKFSMGPGAILGIALSLISFMLYYLEINVIENGWISYFQYLLAGLLIAIFQINYRNQIGNGLMTYGEGVKIGLTIGVFTGIIAGVYSYLFFEFIAPDYIETVMMQLEEKILVENPEMPKEALDSALSISRKIMQPPFSVLISILTWAFWGLILSLITSIFTKKVNAPI